MGTLGGGPPGGGAAGGTVTGELLAGFTVLLPCGPCAAGGVVPIPGAAVVAGLVLLLPAPVVSGPSGGRTSNLRVACWGSFILSWEVFLCCHLLSPLACWPWLEPDRSCDGVPVRSLTLGLLLPVRWPLGCCWSGGYRILEVSRTYARLNSLGSRGAELGSPPITCILSSTAVIPWPERGEGEGPIFWKVYHLRVGIRKAERSPRSLPSSVLPPNIYITSPTRAAA